VVAVTKTPDGMDYSSQSAFPVAAGLQIDYSQLEHVARIYAEDNMQITVMDDNTNATQKKSDYS